MTVWALADLHLAVSNPEKEMGIFGPAWAGYMDKIERNWKHSVRPEDLVLLPGDISWAMTLSGASRDLDWIDGLPGTKVMIKGNHDYWWASSAKMKAALPPSLRFIHNDAFLFGEVAVAGTRLWDTQEYNFTKFVRFKENPKEKKEGKSSPEEGEKIFAKELERLERSLSLLDERASFRIALTHYPPIGADLAPSRTSALLEKYRIDVCVFGHLHSIEEGSLPFGEKNGVRYVFASADYVDFCPVRIR